LRPVPAKATHATLLAGGDAVYDRRARQGSVPVEFHFDDGSTLDGALILTTAELERLYVQNRTTARVPASDVVAPSARLPVVSSAACLAQTATSVRTAVDHQNCIR
ncbi:hypothetical protein ACPXCX_54480, partial [Streptomyces sp. DT225]